MERNGNSEGREGPNGGNFLGGGVGFFFSGSLSKTGELSKTNTRFVEQAISYFTVNDILKQELLFSSMIFY